MAAASHEVRASFTAPPSEVWELVRWENAEVLERAGFFTRVDYADRTARPGAERTMDGSAGSVRERLERLGPEPFTYTYRIVDAGPLPLRSYVGVVRVEPEGAAGSRLTVRSTFEVAGVTEAEWLASYDGMQRARFEYIRSQVG
jgi:hypothetical protein